MMETRLWALVGIWNGQPGLIIQTEEYDDTGYREFGEVLMDIPLGYPEDWEDDSDMMELPWEQALDSLGFRTASGWEQTYLEDSVCFQVEKV